MSNEAGATPALRGIWTVPNAITIVRLCLLPVYGWLLFGAHRHVEAGWLLALLGITDFADGFIARRFNQVSEFGKIIDPVADRVLVATAVITTVIVGAVPWWFAALTLLREVLVSVAVVGLAAVGSARIDVLWIGKAGAFALMISYPMFLGGWGGQWWQRCFSVGAWSFGLVGLVLSWAALVSYIAPAKEALARGRAGRKAASK